MLRSLIRSVFTLLVLTGCAPQMQQDRARTPIPESMPPHAPGHNVPGGEHHEDDSHEEANP